jgi:hypothetical protein
MPLFRSPKSWVLTVSPAYQPGKPLQLGQILRDPGEPATALITPPKVIPPTTTISRQKVKCRGIVYVNHDDIASFKQWLQTNMNSVPESAYLESELFTPTIAYIQQALETPDVPTATQWWRPRSSVFMVTGVTIARDLGTMTDFVFAYRLAEIHHRLGISQKPYADGDAIAIIDDNYSDTASGIVTDEGYVLQNEMATL